MKAFLDIQPIELSKEQVIKILLDKKFPLHRVSLAPIPLGSGGRISDAHRAALEEAQKNGNDYPLLPSS